MANITKTDLTALVAEQTELSGAERQAGSRVGLRHRLRSCGGRRRSRHRWVRQVHHCPALGSRQGPNPQTGETIEIAASQAPKFSAASAFKNAVKG